MTTRQESLPLRITEIIARFGGPFALALVRAAHRFNRDDGWAIASHIALSGIMALFPFLIFCTSLAAFFNLGSFPNELVQLVFDTLPDAVAAPLADQLHTVLTIPRGDVLTLGAITAVFFASNGIEALRLGLNRAYRVQERRNFIVLRLHSIFFVMLGAIMIATVTVLIVLMPLALDIARKYAPSMYEQIDRIDFWRLMVSSAILVFALVASHKWLPAGRRSFADIAPGTIFTLTVWLGAAIGFSAYLRSFADYVSTYAGMASIVIALVFFYVMAAIFLVGAEINSCLIAERQEPELPI
jgi:membrane protein